MKKVFPWLLPFVAFFLFPPAFAPITAGKWIGLYLAALFSAGYVLRGPRILPSIGSRVGLALGIVAAALVGQMFFLRPPGVGFALADRLSFLFLLLGFWKATEEGLRAEDFWLPAVLSTFFLSIFAIAGLGDAGGGILGNPRAAADGVALFLLLASATPAPERERPFVLRAFFSATSALAFFVLISRGDAGSLLALIAAFFCLARIRKTSREASFRFGLGGAALGLMVGLAFVVFVKGGAPAPELTLPERASLWRAAARLAGENPLGVGPGRFEFAALPQIKAEGLAKEGRNLAAPGNELLRYAAEDGFLFLAALIGALTWLLLRWRRGGAPAKALVAPLVLYFSLSAMSGNSGLHAVPVLFLALALGVAMAGAFPVARPTVARTLVLSLGVLGLLSLSGLAISSRSTEANGATAHLACRLTPENWRACLGQAQSLADRRQWQEARLVIESLLADEPWNLAAQLQLVKVAGNQRRDLEACFLLWRFDDFYGEASSLHETYLKLCQPKWREYFRLRRPSRYYERSSPR